MFSSDEARTFLMNIFPSPPQIVTITVSKKSYEVQCFLLWASMR